MAGDIVMLNKILLALSTTTCLLDSTAFSYAYFSLYTRNWHQYKNRHRSRQRFSTKVLLTSSNCQLVCGRSFSMMNFSAGNLEIDQVSEEEEKKPRKKSRQTKVHTVTICVTPPPENVHVWQALSEMRFQLKDPGYYRWPPHVNLLYPFLELPHSSNDVDADGESEIRSEDNLILSDIVEQLESAIKNLVPFSVRLNEFATFGGKRRGVLWLHPDSDGERPQEKCEDKNEPEEQSSSLIRLQTSLEKAFPMCQDQSQKGGGFTPHMTVSHFPSLDEALHAKGIMEVSSLFVDTSRNGTANNSDCLEFVVDRVYLLQRKGDEGQFLRVAEIPMGAASGASSVANGNQTKILDPPQPFPDMPQREDEWVYKERMLQKSRRKNNRKSRR